MSILFLFALGAADLAGLVEQMRQFKLAGNEAAVAHLAPLVRAELEQNHGPHAALAWSQLGVHHSSRGDFAEAERAYRQAIRLAEAHDDKDALSLALLNLALDYLVPGNRPAQAEVLLQRAFSIATAHYGPDSPALTDFLNTLATARHQLGDRPGALLYYKRALVLAGDNPQGQLNKGFILANLSALRSEEKDWPAARDALVEGIALIERYLGPTHPDLIAPSVALARVHSNVRQWERANAALDRAQEITEMRLGPGHWLMAEVLTARAVILRQTGHRSEAKKLEARAKAIATAQPRNPSRDLEIHVSDLNRK